MCRFEKIMRSYPAYGLQLGWKLAPLISRYGPEILNRRLLRSLPHHVPHGFVLIDDVIATVDVNRVACYQLGAVEREEGNRLTNVVNADEAPRRRLALCF